MVKVLKGLKIRLIHQEDMNLVCQIGRPKTPFIIIFAYTRELYYKYANSINKGPNILLDSSF